MAQVKSCPSCRAMQPAGDAPARCNACTRALDPSNYQLDLLEKVSHIDLPLERDYPTVHVRVFDLAEINHAVANLKTLDRDTGQRLARELSVLMEGDGKRPLGKVHPAWAEQLEALRTRHPNFSEVISGVALPQFAISAAGGTARQPPCILVGPPGVGKTHFAKQLAATFRVPFSAVDMSIASSSASLVGLSSIWANSQVGRLFKLLAKGNGTMDPHADPLILLDEVDKARSSPSAVLSDPISSLYGLLEIESARRFQDESVPGVHIDTSYARWVLSANSVDDIPQPIMSRCQVFHIPELTEEERVQVYTRIFHEVVRRSNVDVFSDYIDPDDVARLVKIDMREFKNRCLVAIGRALSESRYVVEPEDFRPVTLEKSRRVRLGFTA